MRFGSSEDMILDCESYIGVSALTQADQAVEMFSRYICMVGSKAWRASSVSLSPLRLFARRLRTRLCTARGISRRMCR